MVCASTATGRDCFVPPRLRLAVPRNDSLKAGEIATGHYMALAMTF